MADRTHIEWTDATWNPVRGCTRVSEGCRNCYAEAVAGRFSGPGQPFYGFADRGRSGSVWTGRVAVVPELLTLPLRWRRPRRIFVNSMSDLFHESLDGDSIVAVFGAMMAAALLRGHILQVLTKRAARMAQLLSQEMFHRRAHAQARDLILDHSPPRSAACAAALGALAEHDDDRTPLPGIWLGVSVENQQAADERIPHLLATPASVRFLSCEPLLGRLSIRHHWLNRPHPQSARIDWIICGGESGPNARPMHPDWARSLRDQWHAAGVPFFFKQWGEWLPVSEMSDAAIDGCYFPAPAAHPEATRRCRVANTVLHANGERFVRPETGAYAQGSRAMMMMRVGKKHAGALLDGREWREFPR